MAVLLQPFPRLPFVASSIPAQVAVQLEAAQQVNVVSLFAAAAADRRDTPAFVVVSGVDANGHRHILARRSGYSLFVRPRAAMEIVVAEHAAPMTAIGVEFEDISGSGAVLERLELSTRTLQYCDAQDGLPRSLVGAVVAQACPDGRDGVVLRRCVAGGDSRSATGFLRLAARASSGGSGEGCGWSDADLTRCMERTPFRGSALVTADLALAGMTEDMLFFRGLRDVEEAATEILARTLKGERLSVSVALAALAMELRVVGYSASVSDRVPEIRATMRARVGVGHAGPVSEGFDALQDTLADELVARDGYAYAGLKVAVSNKRVDLGASDTWQLVVAITIVAAVAVAAAALAVVAYRSRNADADAEKDLVTKPLLEAEVEKEEEKKEESAQ